MLLGDEYLSSDGREEMEEEEQAGVENAERSGVSSDFPRRRIVEDGVVRVDCPPAWTSVGSGRVLGGFDPRHGFLSAVDFSCDV
jgi:hypothetical protein